MKIVGFWTGFIADMNSACKNTLISIFLLNFQIRHNYFQFYQRYSLAIKLNLSKIWKFLIFIYLSSFPSKNIYYDFFWYSAQEFQWKSQKWTEITKTNHFSIFFFFFCIFHENRRILNCFHRRYEFCIQKYPNKHIFVEFVDKT